MSKYSNDEIRAFLADQYGVDVDMVKSGNEIDEELGGDYSGNDLAWLVYGQMRNTSQVDWFFAGYHDDICKDMHNYANRPQ